MKKGFTLVELLGVIIILGLIALITMPVLTNTINQSEEKTYDKQVNIIENSAKEWGVENIDFLPDEDSNVKKVISLKTLIESGKIQNATIQDPRTNEEMAGCVIVKYNSEYKQYEYNYNNDATYCDSLFKGCTYVPEAGTTKKTVGAKYICHLDIDRTFYVLENVESSENISLIMDRNFTDGEVPSNLAWCIAGGTNNTTCQSINSKEEGTPLKHIQDTFGNNVTVSFPTFNQLLNAYKGDMPKWLYDHRISGVYGYWTASTYATQDTAWYVDHHGAIYNSGVNTTDLGVRPVITIKKSDL